jgi:hypothetical protein
MGIFVGSILPKTLLKLVYKLQGVKFIFDYFETK